MLHAATLCSRRAFNRRLNRATRGSPGGTVVSWPTKPSQARRLGIQNRGASYRSPAPDGVLASGYLSRTYGRGSSRNVLRNPVGGNGSALIDRHAIALYPHAPLSGRPFQRISNWQEPVSGHEGHSGTGPVARCRPRVLGSKAAKLRVSTTSPVSR